MPDKRKGGYGLDWTNERYVRQYRANTPSYRILGFEAQAVWGVIRREMDRAGTISCAGLEPHEAVIAVLPGWPPDLVEKGVAVLISREWLVYDNERDLLIDPDFLAAEEAAQSDKLRARESRIRRATLKTSQNVTSPSQNVTDRHDSSQAVTASHDASRDVTPTLPCPALPVPALPEEEKDNANGDRPQIQILAAGYSIELRQRIVDCWEAHAQARATHFRQRNGGRKSHPPTPTKSTVKIIAEAIKTQDDPELLKPGAFEEWKAHSICRKAGIGLFRSELHIEGGYLEQWRPWKTLQGKGSPIERFAALADGTASGSSQGPRRTAGTRRVPTFKRPEPSERQERLRKERTF